MNNFKNTFYTGLSIVFIPFLLLFIVMGVFLVNTSNDEGVDSKYKKVEVQYDTVIVHKTVVDTVRFKVFEKVFQSTPTPKTPIDTI